MADYDFTANLSPLDFELLSKDLIEAELGIQLENFCEGRDKGIDLRYAPFRGSGCAVFNLAKFTTAEKPLELIVQCKRFTKFTNLKSELKNKELDKIAKLNPARYILTTSVSLSPQQVNELKIMLSPFVQSTGDIFGKERLNSILTKHPEIERRQIKLWVESAGVLDSIINAGTHVVSREEVERTLAAAKIYVRNASFQEALAILKKHRVCIISGLPGIGKTTLARMLLLYYFDRKFDIVKIAGDISEARAVGYHNKARFYYYDDFLGQTAQADKLNKNEDQRLIDFIASVRDSKDSVFVLTTREYILNQAKLHYEKLSREKFDHRTCIVDLSKYSRRIRAQILYNHLHFSKLPRTHLKAVVKKRGYVHIIDHKNYNPRLIEYLTDTDWIGDIPPVKYLALFLRKLDNPVEIWEHAFRNQLTDRARHLLFVLTTMPTESRIDDIEQAFFSLHNSQCSKFRIVHSAKDFNNALKELDGTFAATRKVKEIVLVRFQNPSIRDFMQYLLLGGEMLPDVISALIFFEQAQWFVEKLNEEKPQVPQTELIRYATEIVEALKRLLATSSCTISVYGHEQWQLVAPKVANTAARIAAIGKAISMNKDQNHSDWMAARMTDLAANLQSGKLSVKSVVGSINILKKVGYLDSESGKLLILALKQRAMDTPSDLDDFETLVGVIEVLPESFDQDELEAVREAYSDFAEQYAAECDLTSPDDLRNEASRIGDVGELLQVDTDDVQDRLRESADEIESAEESDRADDDDGEDSGGSDESTFVECSDAELDSMFGTLDI
jgi:Novel STAND NTPase 3